jgi:bifunctional non-homologous end joining protein LigD
MRSRSPSSARQPACFIAPCLPTLARTVPSGPQWAHEIKHDGYRMICRRDGDRVRVFSRNGHDFTDWVPRIAQALAALRVHSATIDGEAVVCRPDGVTDFDRLRAALARRGSQDAFLYAFDLVELDGADLRPRPWTGRREALVGLLHKGGDGVVLSEHVAGEHGPAIYQAACRMGLEGIVSKRVDRPYRSGRSPDWIKVRNPEAPAASREFEPPTR